MIELHRRREEIGLAALHSFERPDNLEREGSSVGGSMLGRLERQVSMKYILWRVNRVCIEF